MRHLHVHLAIGIALVGLSATPPSATANTPPPIVKSNTVRLTSTGNAANGTLTTVVTYTDTTVSASASTGNTIGLRAGESVRLRTCLAYHVSGAVPQSRCASRTVDTRANTATVYTYAPAVTLSGQRPTTAPWAYFTTYTEAQYANGTRWTLAAHSWPASGLQGAGIAIAAQEQTAGTLPPNSTVVLDGSFTGAIGSGQADSICTSDPIPSNGSPLPAGVISSHPDYSGAPAYYEIGRPTGSFTGLPPRGMMLVIHGGSWMANGVGGVQAMRADADRWRARGWTTVNFTYRPCGATLSDALWFYDRTRTAVGAMKICALGTSAGANLALLLGAYRPDLYCAVSQAGPTDLRTIQGEVAYNAATGLHDQTLGGRLVHNLGAAAFGEENLSWFSPAALATGPLANTRVLQAFSADDAFVPYAQTADLATAMRATNPAAYVDNIQLARGTIPFGHGRVTPAALEAFYAREAQLVLPVTAAPFTGPGTAADSLR